MQRTHSHEEGLQDAIVPTDLLNVFQCHLRCFRTYNCDDYTDATKKGYLGAKLIWGSELCSPRIATTTTVHGNRDMCLICLQGLGGDTCQLIPGERYVE